MAGHFGHLDAIKPLLNIPENITILGENNPNLRRATAMVNGTIITVDAKDSVAQALAIRDGRIVFVGTSEGARKYVREKTRVIDLAGRTATPSSGWMRRIVVFGSMESTAVPGSGRNGTCL